MPLTSSWPLVARSALDRVVDALDANPAGVALIGNEGVGKTTLAAQSAERLGRGEPLWVLGTLAQSSIPFGAFGPLLDIDDVGRPAALIAAAAESLLAKANSAPIIVDNARLLDPLSATIFSSDPNTYAAIQALEARGMPLADAIRKVAGLAPGER